MKSIFKSKTMIFGTMLSVLGVLQVALPQFSELLDEHTYGILTASVGAIVMVLRAITTQPVSTKTK